MELMIRTEPVELLDYHKKGREKKMLISLSNETKE